MNPSCRKCNESVQEGARCSKCQLVFHYQCVSIAEVGWRRLGSDRQAAWLCPDCKSNAQLNSPRILPRSKTPDGTKTDSMSLHNIELMLESLSNLPDIVEKLRDEVSELSSRINTQIIEELHSRLDVIETKLSTVDFLKTEHNKLTTKIKSYEERFAKMEKETKQQMEYITELQHKTKMLEQEYNRSQQQSRFLNIEIVGVPESSGENLCQILLKVATLIDANLSADDIEFITRVQPHHSLPGRPRRIVAKLKSRRAKDVLIANFRKHNKNKGITSRDLGFECNSTKIFINEHLTIANKILLNNCRRRAEELNVKYVWIKNCSIFMRRNEATPPVQIHSEEDIRKFIT
ncbi:hypothetical protein HF086_010641 [Spodoptera exigua]|uniref:PHD-type domain-containing protein n=1 Tax=Spodoptera exigua TaxID=7107 RepID=A0A922MFD0_SPOEX|nr:hypothetical protein HF086_010641 [Spodoptera exigua]